ncbi:MAG: ribosome small subunit-dependent GTPase A [Steroidobacteraceae bacterium]|nr:ribosome small subunit-dependent GTPase A [Steroidobacteraceae bacterium]
MPFDAQVTAVFGRNLLVRDRAGEEHRARVRGRRLAVVCGDEVVCERDATHGEVHVTEARPRRTALYRSNLRGEAEPVLANLSRLFVVLAPVPVPDFFVVDRYISAATSAGIAPTLVLNKKDLGIGSELQAELNAYATADVAALTCSARSGEGTEALIDAAANTIAALAGQSGVGKSSLIRRLVPGAEVEVGELMRDEEGRHTTTASRMFPLPHGGQLIDSPGVRDFAPAIDVLDPRTLGFTEVARLAPQCRFQDCQHLREPHCAVRAAAEAGTLHPRRYESYRRLRRLYEDLIKARGPKYRPPV